MPCILTMHTFVPACKRRVTNYGFQTLFLKSVSFPSKRMGVLCGCPSNCITFRVHGGIRKRIVGSSQRDSSENVYRWLSKKCQER